MACFNNVKTTENQRLLESTTNLNHHCVCHHCDKKIKNKVIMIQHLKTCLLNRTCLCCNMKFRSRANLNTHAYYIHGDISIEKEIKKDNTCVVCRQSFGDNFHLRSHIRRLHFNLRPKFTSYEDKKINQVWFEKVLNSTKIVEMKKAADNVFLIRKLDDNQKVTVQDSKTMIDLRDIYPIYKQNTKSVCHICKKTMLKRLLTKHFKEKHSQPQQLHHCTNCNKSFKRAYYYVRHICHRIKRNKNNAAHA